MNAGNFLVLLKTVESFAGDLLSVAALLGKMIDGIPAVLRIADVLNQNTRRLQHCKVVEDTTLGLDEIQLEKVHFSYASSQTGQAVAVLPIDLRVPSSCMVCFPAGPVIGRKNAMPGINTLWGLISGGLTPDGGTVRLPSRWRVIYVPVSPMLFNGTLMYNLLFSDNASDPEEAWSVAEALGLSPSLLQSPDFDVGFGGRHLKASDKVIISIARALLHNVDCLLLSSSLDALGEVRALKVLRYLRRYVLNRGIPGGKKARVGRHPKTILYTSKVQVLQSQADYFIDAPKEAQLDHVDLPQETSLQIHDSGSKEAQCFV